MRKRLNIDPTCPPFPLLHVAGVLWDKGQAHALPTVGSDPDGFANGINDQGTAVGYSGSCTTAIHAVAWKNHTAFVLQDTGHGRSNFAFAINNRGQAVGKVRSVDGTTFVASLWQADGTLTILGFLPGDVAAFATGINNRGQVVGNNVDSGNNWSHGFIWQNGVMTDLNTLIPADSNSLHNLGQSNINERGQISGMATVQTASPCGRHPRVSGNACKTESIGISRWQISHVHTPHSTLPANACNHFSQRFRLAD